MDHPPQASHLKPASDDTVPNPDLDDHTVGNTVGDAVRDNEYYFELVVFKVIFDHRPSSFQARY